MKKILFIIFILLMFLFMDMSKWHKNISIGLSKKDIDFIEDNIDLFYEFDFYDNISFFTNINEGE